MARSGPARKKSRQQTPDPAAGDLAELGRIVLDHTTDFIRLSDVDGRSVYGSPSVLRLYGSVPASLFEFAHPDDIGECRRWWNKAIAGDADRLYWRVRNAKGEWRWLETSGSLVQYDNKPHVLTSCRDVTERMEADEALRRSETMLANAARIAHFGGWQDEFGADGRITVMWSDATRRIAGISPGPASLTWEEFRERIHPDDRAMQAMALDRARRGEAPYDLEYRVVRPDGEVRFVHSAGEFIGDGAGRPQRAFGVMQDITERKATENALRASEQRWRNLTEALPQMIWSATPDGTCDYFSSQWTAHTGRPETDLLGWRWLETLEPADRDATRKFWLESVAGRHAYDLEYRVRSNDGEYRWFKTRGVPIRDENGKIIKWFGTCTDITDLRSAEEARRAAEERLRRVVASSPAVLFTLPVRDGEFRNIDFMSDNVEAMLGYRVDETLGADWWLTNIEAQDRDIVVRQFQSEIVSRGYSSAEYRFRHKNGRSRWIRGETRLVRGTEGEPAVVVGSLSDITERRLLEDQLRQAQKLEALGRLAGGVAHDFNNLLTVINGYSELLLTSLPGDDPMRKHLTQIHQAGERAGTLTRQLLLFSRQQVIELKVLDLNVVVTDTERMLHRLIGEDVTLTTVLEPSVALVKADLGQMQQVLMNLSVNARDAMPQGGTLIIETRNVTLDSAYVATHPDVRPGEYVMLRVTDTGTGMDRQTMAHMFEPFFTTKEAGKGTGLGLAVVHGIVNRGGGHLDVRSEVGTGTEFAIYLPATAERLSSGASVAGQQHMPPGTETLLLVEDERAVRALARDILKSCGYTVLEAAGGHDAIRIASQYAGPIDLLVSDVVMPELGGRQVAEQLAVVKPEMKVLFLSGYTDDAVVRHGVLQAEFAFLQKPFTPVGLAQKVRETLDAGKTFASVAT